MRSRQEFIDIDVVLTVVVCVECFDQVGCPGSRAGSWARRMLALLGLYR